ncbi:UNVERIFIED_CONTAM: hypothetical protein GTU68_022451 [Idotea baltica]|nr:hypothetical protein [Idotea baltica]
MTVHKEIK